MIINNLSVVMGKKRMSIAETARLAGLKYSTVDNLYHDKTKSISFETLDKLCFALECEPSELFTYVEK